MSISDIKVVEFHQKQGGQSIAADELTSYLIDSGSISKFHDALPDELQRILAPFVEKSPNAYLNALKSQLKSERWVAVNAASSVPASSYKSAYYPPVQQEPKLVSTQTTVSNTEEDQRQDLEYTFELSCSQSSFSSHVGWDVALAKTSTSPMHSRWSEQENEHSTQLVASIKEDALRTLALSSRDSAVPLSIPDVSAKPKGTNALNEAFLAVMPAVQFGERLGLATQGYYYHFSEGKLVQEYKIIGNGNCRFCLTYSDELTLSDELRPTAWQSAIPIQWRVDNQVLDNQHLLYLPRKLTQDEFSSVNPAWLNEQGLALNISELVDVGQGKETPNERYHAPLNCHYPHPGRLLHGTEIVAINSPSLVAKGIPVINLRPEKLFRIGVFFDGTGANDKNDAYKEQRGNKSRSNVARLFAAYPQIQGESAKIYVSGVGTVDIEDDSQRPAIIDAEKDETGPEQALGVGAQQAFGGGFADAIAGISGKVLLNYVDGENGAFYKWQSLLSQLQRTIDELEQSGSYNDITHIVFDVIGFSRGAALSRHFVNALYQGLPDYHRPVAGKQADVTVYPHLLGNESNKKFSEEGGYERDDTKGVSVRFLGLFDTVGAFYLAGNNDEGNFQLGLEPTMATTVLQLVAEHEYRKNFPLTSLSRDNWLPDNFHQEHFPGCHTDVGGGYPSIEQYEKEGLPDYVGFPVSSTYNRNEIKSETIDIVHANFAYPGGSLDKVAMIERTRQVKDAEWKKTCRQRFGHYGEVKEKDNTLYFYHFKPVSNAIAGLALERMKQQAQNAGVKWIEPDYIENLTPDYVNDELCQSLWANMSTKPLGELTSEDWKTTLQPTLIFDNYIHRSHETVINLPYKTVRETLINSITTDEKTEKTPERRIWDNA
ncbi:phospholipase effector Tle1 domain-containing protein [Vibrio crassostreae]|uniref:phospholipase effector Tle1 domain-containing protein n=1 Tax=Vibrio crassostreae TaxID=246167 RepID=UPI00406781C1